MKETSVREDVESVDNILNWYHRRGGLLPYDWEDYFTPRWNKLKEKLCLKGVIRGKKIGKRKNNRRKLFLPKRR